MNYSWARKSDLVTTAPIVTEPVIYTAKPTPEISEKILDMVVKRELELEGSPTENIIQDPYW